MSLLCIKTLIMLFFNVQGRWSVQSHRAWPAHRGQNCRFSGFLSSRMHFGLFSFNYLDDSCSVSRCFLNIFPLPNNHWNGRKCSNSSIETESPTACAWSCSAEILTGFVSGANEIWWAFCLFQGGAGWLFFCPLHTASSVHQLIHAKRAYNELVILWACEVAARQIWARFRCLIDRKLITWQLNWCPGDSSKAVTYSGIQRLGKGWVFMR